MFRAVLVLLLSLSSFGFAQAENLVRMATTTSTANSGLVDYLLPVFLDDTGFRVHTIAVGTGKALRLGREGDVDVVLVHAREAEEDFVSNGYGVERKDVMYNDFVLVGPASDPAGISRVNSVEAALGNISSGEHFFISRGDDSGTHKRELILWDTIGGLPDNPNYRAVGQGMGKTLQIANEFDGYTLTDRGTWLAFQDKLQIKLLFEGNPRLFNPYGIIAVNPVKHPDINHAGATALVEWMTSPKAQQLIGEFRMHGETLFVPNAID